MSHYFSKVSVVARISEHPWLQQVARQGPAYRDHALLWKLFPGDGHPRDFVFRRLPDESYYVVSSRAPTVDLTLFRLQTKPYSPQIQAGTWLRFDLRANPTITRRAVDGPSKRHDVLMDAKRRVPANEDRLNACEAAGREWLLARAEHWGLSIRDDSIQQEGYSQHRLRRKGARIEYSSLDYRGIACVTDTAKLHRTLLAGAGRAKGFGCGLLLVRKLD